MKKVLTLVFAMTCLIGYSQNQQEEVDYYQSIFGMNKKEVVAEMISVENSKSDAFWNLYDEYETSRKALGQERVQLLQQYANTYDNLQADQLNALVNKSMSLSAKTDKLIKTYYKKINKEVGTETAAQFYQIESYLVSEIRAAILGNIPMFQNVAPKTK